MVVVMEALFRVLVVNAVAAQRLSRMQLIKSLLMVFAVKLTGCQ